MTTHTQTRHGTGLIAAAVLALAVTACTGGAVPAATTGPTPTPEPTAAAAATPSPTSVPIRGAKPAGPTAIPAADGTVPAAIVTAAVADVATHAGVSPADVTVVSADAVTWPNGAAGCPRMGVMYTDVVTPGYRVVLDAGGKTYDYRGSRQSGAVTWCENARPLG